jgi:hypothetical protein
MKCRVCSQETPGPARLCATCDAAMKRAREALTLERQPVAPSTDPAPSAVLSRRRRGAVWIAAGALASVAAAYWGQSEQSAPPAAATAVSAPVQGWAQPSATRATMAPGVPEPARRETEAPKTAHTAATATPRTAEPAGAGPKPPTRPAQVAALPPSVAETRPPSAPVMASAKPTPSSATASEAGISVPPRLTAPTVSDGRWRDLADALGRCAAEGFLTRLGCEERARWNYCAGAWGEVPDCPAAHRAESSR